MNRQFTKTIEALEAAENEMIALHNLLDSLEIRNAASWHETQEVAGYRERLKSMQASIRTMLGKREKQLLTNLLSQTVDLTNTSLRWCKKCNTSHTEECRNDTANT